MFAKLLLKGKKVAVFIIVYIKENIYSLFIHAKLKVNSIQFFLYWEE